MTTAELARHSEQTALIWSIAELLRGDFKASDYGKVVFPFTMLRRLDCLLEPTKAAVVAAAKVNSRRSRRSHAAGAS